MSPVFDIMAPANQFFPPWAFSTPAPVHAAPANRLLAAAVEYEGSAADDSIFASDLEEYVSANNVSTGTERETTAEGTVQSADLSSAYAPSTPTSTRPPSVHGRLVDDCGRADEDEVRLFQVALKVVDKEALKLALRVAITRARPSKKAARALYEVSAPVFERKRPR